MEYLYKLNEEIGIELLARSKALALAEQMGQNNDTAIFDFNGVVFVSRSFADELCNIADSFGERVTFINMSANVEEMISIVSESRKKTRLKGHVPPKFHHFTSVKSLSDFMLENC